MSRWNGFAAAALLLALGGAGCVCRSGSARPSAPPPPPPPPQAHVYIGAHPVPANLGGGWDATPQIHSHNYAPDPVSGYRR